jgi:HAMP domain-containing protein
MENKKSVSGGIHRDGYTWKDSMIVSILLFFMMFFVGSGIGLALGSIFKLFKNEGNASFVQILQDNFGFLGYWIIAIVYLLAVKSDRPILRAFGTEPRGNTVKMALWGLLIGLGLTWLIYAGINEGLRPIFGKGTDISQYMPDNVMTETPLDTVKALAVALIWGAVFLISAIRIFDMKDVK